MPVGKLIWVLAIPTILAQVINALYNIVDRIYLGHIPTNGALILTGVGLTYPIITLIAAFSQLVGAGGAPLAAISLGSGNKEKAEKIMSQGFFILIIIAIILTVLFQVFKRPLLFMFGASNATITYAENYLSIYLIGTIFVQICLGMNLFISSQGFASHAMTTVLIGAVLNIILDPIFIFIFNMGEKGAALATIISQAVSALWVIRFLSSKTSILHLNFKQMLPSWKILTPVLALGVSPFIMNATEAAINIVFNSTLQRTGGDYAVGTMTIISSIMSFCWMPVSGFSQGSQPIISYNFGAGNNDRVKQTFRILLITLLIYTFTFMALLELFPSVAIGIFTSDKALSEYAVPYLRIYFAGIGIFGLQMACQQAFLGLGQAKISMFLALLRKVFLLIPLVLILSRTALGVTGAFLAEPISDITSALVAITLFSLNFGKILKKGVQK